MKILAIGDIHIKTTNIPEIELLKDSLLTLITEQNPDLIIILGDILDTHEKLHTICLNYAYDLILSLRDKAPIYILVGNHDMISNQQFLTSNHWMNGLKEWDKVKVVDKIVEYTDQKYTLLFIPYVPPGRFEEALNTYKNGDWKQVNIIFAHQEFYGCKMGAIISEDGDRWKDDYPLVVSGHIHSKQRVQKNIYYTGSAIQHAFGESEKNIIPIIICEEEISINEINLNLPRKRTIYKSVKDLETLKLKESKDQIRISVSGTYEEFKNFKKSKKYKELLKTGSKIVFKNKPIIEIEKKRNNKTDFEGILNQLIEREKDVYLYQVHQKLIYDKDINEEDILII